MDPREETSVRFCSSSLIHSNSSSSPPPSPDDHWFPFGLTVLLEVDPDLVGLGAGGSGPRVSRLLFRPRGDVAPVEASIGQLDAGQTEPELSRAGLRQNQTVPGWKQMFVR